MGRGRKHGRVKIGLALSGGHGRQQMEPVPLLLLLLLRSSSCMPPAPASLLTGGRAGVGQQVDVALLQRVRREAPVPLGAAGVVVLKEGHRPGGPPTHEAGGLARRVLQAPVLAALKHGVQDALGGDVCGKGRGEGRQEKQAGGQVSSVGQTGVQKEIAFFSARRHLCPAPASAASSSPAGARRHSPKAVARPPAALIPLTMRCRWASWLCAGVPSSW